MKIIFVFFFVTFFLSKLTAQDKELEKLLQLDLEELTELKVISATKSLKRINRVPATVEVITAAKIKTNGYLTLDEALSDLPGFQFRNINGFNSYIFQRGIPNQNNYTLLLVDGVEINELNSGGFYGGAQFNMENIKQIEVVYGPASSLYGTNAISGVINIVTKDPSEDDGINLSGLVGSFNTYRANASYNYYDEDKQFGLRISGMFYNSEKADLSGAEGDYNWSSDMENFERNYSINIKSTYKDFIAGVLYQNKQASRTTNYKSIGTPYQDKNSLWNIGFLNAFIKHSLNISDDLGIQSRLVYRNSIVYDNTIAYVTDSAQVGYYRPNHSVLAEALLFYKPTDFIELTGGILYESEWLAEDFSVTYSETSLKKPPVPEAPTLIKDELLSPYLQADLTIIDSLDLFAGARYDYSTVYGNVITPRLGLVFNSNGITFKTLYSEAFRAPKPWDYTSGLGNSNLNPEKMRAIEFSAGYRLDKNFRVGTAFYYNKLIDIITQQPNNNSFRWVNDETAEVKGAEITSEFTSKDLMVFLNYTYTFSTDKNGAQIPEVSKHTLSFGSSIKLFEKISIALRGNYFSERINPSFITGTNSGIVDDAIIFHSSIYYSGFENFTFSLSIKNIFDTKYYHTSNRPPERYRQPQRTILFGIDYHF